MTPHDVLASFASAVDRVEQLDGRFLALALVFQVGNHVLQAVAWRNVLQAVYPDTRVPLLGVGASYAAGVALNAVLPARGGEVAKVGLVRTQIPGSAVPAVAASSSLILLFDVVAGAALFALAWSFGSVPLPALPSLDGSSAALVAPVLVVGGVVVAVAALGPVRARVGRMLADARHGFAILAMPGRYARRVAAPQLAGWTCRVGVVFALLAAFHLPASVPLAVLVVVAGGVTTLLPATPGGVGAQQAMLIYVLHETMSTAHALAFSVSMQVAVTAVNCAIGVGALMLLFGTLRPGGALRAGVAVARAGRHTPD